MDWLQLLKEGGFALVLIVIFLRYVWPFLMKQVETAQATADATIKQMNELQLSAQRQIAETKAEAMQEYVDAVKRRDQKHEEISQRMITALDALKMGQEGILKEIRERDIRRRP